MKRSRLSGICFVTQARDPARLSCVQLVTLKHLPLYLVFNDPCSRQRKPLLLQYREVKGSCSELMSSKKKKKTLHCNITTSITRTTAERDEHA